MEIYVCDSPKIWTFDMEIGVNRASNVDVDKSDVEIKFHADGDSKVDYVVERMEVDHSIKCGIKPGMDGAEGQAYVNKRSTHGTLGRDCKVTLSSYGKNTNREA